MYEYHYALTRLVSGNKTYSTLLWGWRISQWEGLFMKFKSRLKSILVSLLVTTALVVPAVVVAMTPAEAKAYLLFQLDGQNGSGLYTMDDGSIQARIAVSIHGGTQRSGASFILDYNPDYFTPSDADNKPVDEKEIDTDTFFTYNPDLYGGVNPFAKEVEDSSNPDDLGANYSQFFAGQSQIIMNLWLDRNLANESKDKVEKLDAYSFTEKDKRYAFVDGEDITLGYLTFRVNPDRLSEIAQYFHNFGGGEMTENPEVDADYPGNKAPDKTFLVKVPQTAYGDWGAIDPWSIGYYEGADGKKTLEYYRKGDAATVFYKNEVDNNTIVAVRPAEDEVTVNAYQAYTNGDMGDLALVLRQYSPMATVTYLDGREENVVIPWGSATANYTVKSLDHGEVTEENYDPTQGEYIAYQNVPEYFPMPIKVRLHVTPITLQSIQVEDQTKTYRLDEVVGQIEEPSDLALPDQARLVTDIVPGGVSMVMDIPGWAPEKGTWPRLDEGNTNQSKLMNSLKEDSFSGDENDPAAEPKWPDNDDINVIEEPEHFLGKYNDQWLGKYTFHMAEGYGTAETPKPAAKDGFTKEELQAVYPWLTVPNDKYPVPNALRQIVTKDNFTTTNAYKVEYISTVDESILGQTEPKLTLNVSRQDSHSMADTSIFRVWLPDGQELGTGLTADVWPGTETTTVDNWFPEHTEEGGATYQNGYYEPEKRTIGDVQSFDLTTNPGNPEDDTYNKERETLRRYINLGGWFYVAVTEEPDSRTWSDPMPVYVPPRVNKYTEDKEYNFLGDNSNLFVWSGGLTHYVTMPRGEYNDVNEYGEALYLYDGSKVTADGLHASQKDSYGRPNQYATRATASYAYTTTYDGTTGAQPGTLTTFQVDKANRPESETPPARGELWPYTTSSAAIGTIFTYGPNPFFDGAVYGSYGEVNQHRDADNTVPDPKTATIRRDSNRTVPGSQKITLTSVEPTGITREVQDDLTSNVTQVTYNTKEEGYTARQSYTLTITNHGTEPVYGLAIDTLTDGYEQEPTGGHFIMEKAPADYLAPGASTSFVLTYVYDLAANPSPDQPYHDILYITSSDHPTGGVDADANYLLKFDAEVLVSSQPTHNVHVVVKPGDLSMGTANLIIGQQFGSGDINYTPTARSYAYGAEVYLVVEPKDEYSIYEKPTAVDALGYTIEVTEVSVPEGQNPVYKFTMPNYDATVTVCFFEDTYSKLRLSDLIDFSGDKEEDLKEDLVNNPDDTVAPEDTYTVWRKSFTDDDYADAANWVATKANGAQEDLYLMTAGRPISKEENGNTFISSENQYIVVIPFDAAYSQVEAKLRELVTHNDYKGNGENKDITPDVTMNWYGKDILNTWSATTDSDVIIYSGKGDTDKPTKHTSAVFDSPEPGTSNYVRITVQSENVLRYYYLEIHRRPENPIATLHYGNSPYGMIMNAPNFQGENAAATANLRQVAKDAFRAGYTFKGLAQNYLPKVLQGDSPVVDVNKVTYWREAWVNNTLPFEPESNTGYVLHTDTVTDGVTGETTQYHSYIPDVGVYDETTNLDLNDYAYFATLGMPLMEPGLVEALDSSGRPVDLEKIMASAEVTLLDTSKTTQLERFSGTETVTLDLGVANQVKTALNPAAQTATDASWPASSKVETKTETAPDGTETTTQETVYTPVHNIRPGQYVLTYTYPDFDGGSLSVTRPFVILPRTGDVNVDGYLNSTRFPEDATPDAKKLTDEYVLENRVADLLGYEAGKWEEVDGVWTETVYPRANIFKFRVCDVNNDRNVNNIDGNELNLLARDPDGLHPLKFYEPVNYGHPNYTPVTP